MLAAHRMPGTENASPRVYRQECLHGAHVPYGLIYTQMAGHRIMPITSDFVSYNEYRTRRRCPGASRRQYTTISSLMISLLVRKFSTAAGAFSHI